MTNTVGKRGFGISPAALINCQAGEIAPYCALFLHRPRLGILDYRTKKADMAIVKHR
jgi:hypothetical protein